MAIIYGTPTVVSASNPASVSVPAIAGRHGELLTSSLHGRWMQAALMGRLFVAGSLIAGITIPVNTATAATCVIHNPLGSGVVLELASFDVGWPAAAASVVGTILLSMSTQTPTSVTSGGYTLALPIGGGGVPQGKFYTAATVTAVTSHLPMITASTVTDTMNPSHVEFEGKVSIAPGGMAHVTSTPVQTAVSLPAFIWAEWPT
jgi:hypothetical protein